MRNHNLNSFLIHCILLISITINTYAKSDNPVCFNKGYNDPNLLIGDSCIAPEALIAAGGDGYFATMLTMMSFTDTPQGVDSLGSIDNFFSGSKKACLQCSGSTESELQIAEEKLLDRVNEKRSEYGATLYRDVVINNQISASELTSALDEEFLTCSEEIEQLDNECQVKFKESIKSIEGFKGIRFKDTQGIGINTEDVFRSIKSNILLTVGNSKRNYGKYMYRGVSRSFEEFNDDNFKPIVKSIASNAVWSERNLDSDMSVMFKYEDAVTNYYKVQDAFVEKLRDTSSEDFKSYCSGKDDKFVKNISSEIAILDSYASLKGKITRDWICNSFETKDFKRGKLKNKSLSDLFDLDNNPIDLSERIKTNCQNQFREIEETICKPKEKVDSSIFHNFESIYSEEPFDILLSELEDEHDILTFKALACIYHDQATGANDLVENMPPQDVNSSPSVRRMTNGSDAQGYFSSKGTSSEGSFDRLLNSVAEDSESSSMTGANDSVESLKTRDNLDTPGSFEFFNNNTPENNNAFYPSYSPSSFQSSIVNDAKESTDTQDKVNSDKIKALNDEIATLKKKREELDKMERELAEVKESIDKKELEKMTKEKQELDDKIADLEKKKEEVVVAESKKENINNKQSSSSIGKVSKQTSRKPASSNQNSSAQTQSESAPSVTKSQSVNRESASESVSFPSNSNSSVINLKTATLEVTYNKKLETLLNSGKSSEQGMIELIREMTDKNIPIHFRIVKRNGVETVIFPDLNREIQLKDFEPKTQKEFQQYVQSAEYRSREIASSEADKRETVIDLTDDFNNNGIETKDLTYKDLIYKYKEIRK